MVTDLIVAIFDSFECETASSQCIAGGLLYDELLLNVGKKFRVKSPGNATADSLRE